MNYHNNNRRGYSNTGGHHHYNNHRHSHQQRNSHHDHMYGIEMDVEGAVVEDYEQQRQRQRRQQQYGNGGYYNESHKGRDDDDNESSLSQCLCCIACLFLIACAVLVGMTFLVWNNDKAGKNKGNNKVLPWYYNTSLLLNLSQPIPFSLLDPVQDLDLREISERSEDSTPPKKVLKNYNEWLDTLNTQRNIDNDIPIPTKKRLSVPTNVWYENLLLLQDNEDDKLAKPKSLHRVHTIPYVIDMAGIIPGVQIHGRSVWDTTNTTTQLSVVDPFSLLLGAHVDFNQQELGSSYMHDDSSYRYTITSGTELGVTLQWVSTLRVFLNLILFQIFDLHLTSLPLFLPSLPPP